MPSETYLNHPTFGLLFSLCQIGSDKSLFTTLYAQRLFFVVTTTSAGLEFATVSRNQARIMVENQLRDLWRSGERQTYDQLQAIHRRTFQ